jgi:hypothetical protein
MDDDSKKDHEAVEKAEIASSLPPLNDEVIFLEIAAHKELWMCYNHTRTTDALSPVDKVSSQ